MIKNKIYTPGEVICALGDNVPGKGTYINNNQIVAAIVGRV